MGWIGQVRHHREHLTRHRIAAELVGVGFNPLHFNGVINIWGTSALLNPAVQGQDEAVTLLTHTPSSYRTIIKHFFRTGVKIVAVLQVNFAAILDPI